MAVLLACASAAPGAHADDLAGLCVGLCHKRVSLLQGLVCSACHGTVAGTTAASKGSYTDRLRASGGFLAK